MTPTEKQKYIAEQAVYGDLKGFTTGVALTMYLANLPMYINEEWKPILRPLPDLAKEITHEGYNDDEPFVPAAIINKMELGTYAINLGLDSLRPRRHIKENDLLHQWHFDTRGLIEAGEAVDANTLDINPYSAQL